MYDSETSYYSNPSSSSFKYLLYIYKKGMDYYTKKNEKYVKFLTIRMNSLITLHFDIENNLKLIYLINNIKKNINKLEEPKENDLLENKLKEISKDKIKNFEKNINSNIIMIKLNLRNQRNNFIKRTRNKLFNKFIKKNSNINEYANNANILENKNKKLNITPKKDIDINNNSLKHEIMIRTKGNSNMKQYFFPTQIFFDEDINYLFENKITLLKKEEKLNIESMTNNFIECYSLSYSNIIQEFIKKIIDIFNENYREKIKKYEQHCEIVSFYDMILKDEYYKKDLIKNEIELHRENIKYLNELNDLQNDKNDKIINIIDRFKINNPIDNKITNEIVNDYVYGILEIFI